MIRAAETLGGVPAVASYLRVSPGSVEDWLAGKMPIPDMVFLRVVDLLLFELTGLDEAAGALDDDARDLLTRG
jgi:hypothetical protein